MLVRDGSVGRANRVGARGDRPWSSRHTSPRPFRSRRGFPSGRSTCGPRPGGPPSWQGGPDRGCAPACGTAWPAPPTGSSPATTRSSRSRASSPTCRRPSGRSRPTRPPSWSPASATPITRGSWSSSSCLTPPPGAGARFTATRACAGAPCATSPPGPTRTASATTRPPTCCSPPASRSTSATCSSGSTPCSTRAPRCRSRPTACPTSTPPAGWPTSAWRRSGPPSTPRARPTRGSPAGWPQPTATPTT
jgi:hypothetical protein